MPRSVASGRQPRTTTIRPPSRERAEHRSCSSAVSYTPADAAGRRLAHRGHEALAARHDDVGAVAAYAASSSGLASAMTRRPSSLASGIT